MSYYQVDKNTHFDFKDNYVEFRFLSWGKIIDRKIYYEAIDRVLVKDKSVTINYQHRGEDKVENISFSEGFSADQIFDAFYEKMKDLGCELSYSSESKVDALGESLPAARSILILEAIIYGYYFLYRLLFVASNPEEIPIISRGIHLYSFIEAYLPMFIVLGLVAFATDLLYNRIHSKKEISIRTIRR